MYLTWNEKTITDFSDQKLNALYNEGWLFTREGKGKMYETRSLRVDLEKFELSSENRRVLRKTEDVLLSASPIPYKDYNWEIGKLGKDFYETKFGDGIFSANKIKELMTDKEKSNLNRVMVYCHSRESGNLRHIGADPHFHGDDKGVGYCICLETDELLHYCYPFYSLTQDSSSLGIGMMTKAIVWAKENNKKYVYLGSATRPTDTYKLQFTGLEWWNGKIWQTDLEELKKILKNS